MSHELRREERIQHNQAEQLLLIEEELKEAKETIEKLYTELKKVDGKKLKVLDYGIDEISYVNKLCETIKELEIKNDKLQLERKHDKKEISILNDEVCGISNIFISLFLCFIRSGCYNHKRIVSLAQLKIFSQWYTM